MITLTEHQVTARLQPARIQSETGLILCLV